jgi:hypothetical protein
VLLVSLVGHYERTAEHLASRDGLGSYPAVDGPALLRIRARSVGSLLRGLMAVGRHLLTRPQPLLGIPRSNSRAVRLLTACFPQARVFSYSDGLGDVAHDFYLQRSARYVGHVGFALLSPQPLIHTIALEQCIEPWSRFVTYRPDAPLLLIVKQPKEVNLRPSVLATLHRRALAALAKRGEVVLSGTIEGLDRTDRQIGPLALLDRPLAVSGVIGLPSTAFLTLAARLPANRLRILRLPCARRHPEAQRRQVLMRQTLTRCVDAMRASASK